MLTLCGEKSDLSTLLISFAAYTISNVGPSPGDVVHYDLAATQSTILCGGSNTVNGVERGFVLIYDH